MITKQHARHLTRTIFLDTVLLLRIGYLISSNYVSVRNVLYIVHQACVNDELVVVDATSFVSIVLNIFELMLRVIYNCSCIVAQDCRSE